MNPVLKSKPGTPYDCKVGGRNFTLLVLSMDDRARVYDTMNKQVSSVRERYDTFRDALLIGLSAIDGQDVQSCSLQVDLSPETAKELLDYLCGLSTPSEDELKN